MAIQPVLVHSVGVWPAQHTGSASVPPSITRSPFGAQPTHAPALQAQVIPQVSFCTPASYSDAGAAQPWLEVAPGAQTPWPAQPPASTQAQLALHTELCVPQLPQAAVVVAVGAQAPSPVQAPASTHSQVELQSSCWVPQLPQATPLTAPGVHCAFAAQLGLTQPPSGKQTSPIGQLPFAHRPPQPSLCPQLASAQAVEQQAPWLQTCPASQVALQAPKSPQTQFARQLRACVSQAPQPWVWSAPGVHCGLETQLTT